MKFHYWLIENTDTSWNERAVGTEEEVEVYLENRPHLCNPRIVDWEEEFEGCIDLGLENNLPTNASHARKR
jgi:hypothetical protein